MSSFDFGPFVIPILPFLFCSFSVCFYLYSTNPAVGVSMLDCRCFCAFALVHTSILYAEALLTLFLCTTNVFLFTFDRHALFVLLSKQSLSPVRVTKCEKRNIPIGAVLSPVFREKKSEQDKVFL